MASDNEASCASDPNFAVICSFLKCFGKSCGIVYPDIALLQDMLENTQEVPQQLIDLHIKLLRKTRKTVSPEKWERALVKFCHTYSNQDGWELERFGYKKARIAVKLRLLKVLLEAQFDLNQKFKNEVNKLAANELRVEPLGRDKCGLAYWCQLDDECNIRVYREDIDEENWDLVAKDRDGVVNLINTLSNGEVGPIPINEDSNSLEISDKPIIDTGQVTTSPSLEEETVHINGAPVEDMHEKKINEEIQDFVDDRQQDDLSNDAENDEEDLDAENDVTNDESSKQNTEEDDSQEMIQNQVAESNKADPLSSLSSSTISKTLNGKVDALMQKEIPSESSLANDAIISDVHNTKSVEISTPGAFTDPINKIDREEPVPLKSIETPVITSPLKLVNIAELKQAPDEKNISTIMSISASLSITKKHSNVDDVQESVVKPFDKLLTKSTLSFGPPDITGHNKISIKPIDQLAANLVRIQSEKLEKPGGPKSLEKIAENLARTSGALGGVINGEDDRLQDFCTRSQTEKSGMLRGHRGMDLSTSPRGWESANEQSRPMDFSGIDLSSRKFTKTMDLPPPGYRSQDFQHREMDLSTKKLTKSDVPNLPYDARTVMLRNHAMVADLSKRQMPFSAYELSSTAYHNSARLPSKEEHRLPNYTILPDPSKITSLRMGAGSVKRPMEGDDVQQEMLKRIRADVIPIRGSMDKRSMISNNWREEVSEPIEEPMMMIQGEGSGSDCDTMNVIIEEAIEEPTLFFYGEGSGTECTTGNPGDDTSADNKESNESKSEADSASVSLSPNKILSVDNLNDIATETLLVNKTAVKLNRNFSQPSASVQVCQVLGSVQEKPKFKPTLGVQIIPKSASGSVKRSSRWDVGKPEEKAECDSSIISNEANISIREGNNDSECHNIEQRRISEAELLKYKVGYEDTMSVINQDVKVDGNSLHDITTEQQGHPEAVINKASRSNSTTEYKTETALHDSIQCDSSISSCQPDTSVVDVPSTTNDVTVDCANDKDMEHNVSDCSILTPHELGLAKKIDGNECKDPASSPPRFFFGPNCISYTSKTDNIETEPDQTVSTSIKPRSGTLQYECVSSSKSLDDVNTSCKSADSEVMPTNNNLLKVRSFTSESHDISGAGNMDTERRDFQESSNSCKSQIIMKSNLQGPGEVIQRMPDEPDNAQEISYAEENLQLHNRQDVTCGSIELQISSGNDRLKASDVVSQSGSSNNVLSSIGEIRLCESNSDSKHLAIILDKTVGTEESALPSSISEITSKSPILPETSRNMISDVQSNIDEIESSNNYINKNLRKSSTVEMFKSLDKKDSEFISNSELFLTQDSLMEARDLSKFKDDNNSSNSLDSTNLSVSVDYDEAHNSAGRDNSPVDFQALKKCVHPNSLCENYDKQSDRNDNLSEPDVQEEQSTDIDIEKMKGLTGSDADSMCANFDKNSERTDVLSDLGMQDEGSGDSEEIKQKSLSNAFIKDATTVNSEPDVNPEEAITDSSNVTSTLSMDECKKDDTVPIISSSNNICTSQTLAKDNINMALVMTNIEQKSFAKEQHSTFNVLPTAVPDSNILEPCDSHVDATKTLGLSGIVQNTNEDDDVSENPSSCVDQDSNEDMVIDDRVSESNESLREIEERTLSEEKLQISNDDSDNSKDSGDACKLPSDLGLCSDKEYHKVELETSCAIIEKENTNLTVVCEPSESVKKSDDSCAKWIENENGKPKDITKGSTYISSQCSDQASVTTTEKVDSAQYRFEINKNEKLSEDNMVLPANFEESVNDNKQSLVPSYDSSESNDGSDDVFEADIIERIDSENTETCNVEKHEEQRNTFVRSDESCSETNNVSFEKPNVFIDKLSMLEVPHSGIESVSEKTKCTSDDPTVSKQEINVIYSCNNIEHKVNEKLIGACKNDTIEAQELSNISASTSANKVSNVIAVTEPLAENISRPDSDFDKRSEITVDNLELEEKQHIPLQNAAMDSKDSYNLEIKQGQVCKEISEECTHSSSEKLRNVTGIANMQENKALQGKHDIFKEDIIKEDSHKEDIIKEGIVTKDMVKEDIVNKDIVNKDIVNKDIINEDVVKEDTAKVDIVNRITDALVLREKQSTIISDKSAIDLFSEHDNLPDTSANRHTECRVMASETFNNIQDMSMKCGDEKDVRVNLQAAHVQRHYSNELLGEDKINSEIINDTLTTKPDNVLSCYQQQTGNDSAPCSEETKLVDCLPKKEVCGEVQENSKIICDYDKSNESCNTMHKITDYEQTNPSDDNISTAHLTAHNIGTHVAKNDEEESRSTYNVVDVKNNLSLQSKLSEETSNCTAYNSPHAEGPLNDKRNTLCKVDNAVTDIKEAHTSATVATIVSNNDNACSIHTNMESKISSSDDLVRKDNLENADKNDKSEIQSVEMKNVTSDDSIGTDNENVFNPPAEEADPLACTDDDTVDRITDAVDEDTIPKIGIRVKPVSELVYEGWKLDGIERPKMSRKRRNSAQDSNSEDAGVKEEENEMMGGKRIKLRGKRIPDKQLRKSVEESRIVTISSEDEAVKCSPVQIMEGENKDGSGDVTMIRTVSNERKSRGRPRGRRRRGYRGPGRPPRPKLPGFPGGQISEVLPDMQIDGVPSNISSLSMTPTTTQKRRKKRKMVLGLEIGRDIEPEAESGLMQNETPVRQSRRIAQLKIKEEAVRRRIEEEALIELKEKKDITEKKKRKKQKHESEEEVVIKEVERESKSKKKHKKKKKKKMLAKFNEANPWQSSSGSSSDEENENEDEDEDEDDIESEGSLLFKSDHEFSPESDLEKDQESEPLRRARTAQRAQSDDEEADDEYACQKCGKADHPEWILLCDSCDKGWHCSCLRPALMLIPEGDWFCPPCQHSLLVVKLRDSLKIYDQQSKRHENELLRKKRLAFVGISLDNVLHKGDPQRHEKESKASSQESDNETSSSSSESSSQTTSSDESEPVYQLRERRCANTYKFNEYDDMINAAIQDEVEAVQGAGNQGRGKDIATIVNAEKEEAQFHFQTEALKMVEMDEDKDDVDRKSEKESDEDYKLPKEEIIDEEEEDRKRVAKKLLARKKHRKLNSLDISSEDDPDSDEDFKGTSSEEEEDFDDHLTSTDESSFADKRRSRKGDARAVRRSTRARMTRYDEDFINDDSEDSDRPKRKKSRSLWGDSDSEDSDNSWRQKKKKSRTIPTSRYRTSSKTKGKKKKKRKRIIESDNQSENDEEEETGFGEPYAQQEVGTTLPEDVNVKDASAGKNESDMNISDTINIETTGIQQMEGVTPPKKKKETVSKQKKIPSIRRKIIYGGLPDDNFKHEEEETLGRRTRGRKINYQEVMASDSEEELKKALRKTGESEDEFLVNDAEDMNDDAEKDSDSGDIYSPKKDGPKFKNKSPKTKKPRKSKSPAAKRRTLSDGAPKQRKKPGPKPGSKNKARKQSLISSVIKSKDELDAEKDGIAHSVVNPMGELTSKLEEGLAENVGLASTTMSVASSFTGDVPEGSLTGLGPGELADLDDDQLEQMMMEDEEYGRRQLELAAIEIAKKKKKEEREAKKLEKARLKALEILAAERQRDPNAPEGTDGEAPKKKKRGRRSKAEIIAEQMRRDGAPTLVTTNLPPTSNMAPDATTVTNVTNVTSNVAPSLNSALSTVVAGDPDRIQDGHIPIMSGPEGQLFNPDGSPMKPKRRGRGKGSSTSGSAPSTPPAGVATTQGPPPSTQSSNSQPVYPSLPPSQQSSVITRMLQSQPVSSSPQSFTAAAAAMGHKYFGGGPNAAGQMIAAGPRPGYDMPRGRIPSPYRQPGQSSMPPHFAAVRSGTPPMRMRVPGPQMYHTPHHPMDPSPSGGGPISINNRDRSSPLGPGPAMIPPAAGSPLAKSGPTPTQTPPPPPPPYVRAGPPLSRFGDNPMAGPRHQMPPFTNASPANHAMQQPSPPPSRPPGNFSPYHPPPPPNYHYGAYPPPPPMSTADDAAAYQSSPYPPEHFSSPADNQPPIQAPPPPQPPPPPQQQQQQQQQQQAHPNDGVVPGNKQYDEEGTGEFGGLVSYFSSQREDDLDS